MRHMTFAIALPPEWLGLDLLGPEAETYLEAPLARALATAAHGGEHAELVMLRSLVARAPTGRPLSAGLAVTVADTTTPVANEPLTPDDFTARDVAAVTLRSGSGLRVRHISSAALLAESGPQDVLHVQYLIHHELGLLTMTFTTLQMPEASEWEELFDAMAATAELA